MLMFCKSWLCSWITHFQHLAMVIEEDDNGQSGNGIDGIVVHSRILLDNPSRCVLVFFLLRWRCREHFVSGCWYSSGRDCGRHPRECWLSTLGVLHPGVPVMWFGHIRDLFPTAEGCMGSRPAQCNVVTLGTTRVVLWCYVSDGSVIGGWLGRVCTTLHLHAPNITYSTTASFVSLPPWPCSWRDALCSQVCCRGNGWQAINPRCPGCLSLRGMRASPRSGNSTGILPQLLL